MLRTSADYDKRLWVTAGQDENVTAVYKLLPTSCCLQAAYELPRVTKVTDPDVTIVTDCDIF